MLWLIEAFWGVCKHHLICPCRSINFRVFQQMNYCALLPCSLVSFLLSTTWNTLTGLHGVIEIRKKMHWVFESWPVTLLLCWSYTDSILKLHIFTYSIKLWLCHFSLVAFLALVLSTGITLGCDHTLVALGYVYLLWLKGRSSQKSISDALPVSTLSEHYRETLSKTKL